MYLVMVPRCQGALLAARQGIWLPQTNALTEL